MQYKGKGLSNQSASDSMIRIDWDCLLKDIIKQWFFILLAAAGAALLVSAVMQYRYKPSYSSTTTFVIGKNGFSNNMIYENLNSAEDYTKLFSHVIESTVLRQQVCEDLNLDSYNVKTSVTTVPSSNLMVMTVTADTPRLAFKASRSISRNAKKLTKLLGGEITVQVISSPLVSTSADNPLRTKPKMKLAALIAAAAAILAFGLVSCMKDTIKNRNDIENKLDTRLLGTLYHERKSKIRSQAFSKKKVSLLINQPLLSFRYVESCRLLASRIVLNMRKENAKTLMITSVSENEGKSTVAANIAMAMAQEGHKVFLFDCDFRKPSQYKIFEIDREKMADRDLASMLSNKSEIRLTPHNEQPNLHLVLSVKARKKPWDRDSMAHLQKIINVCKKYADFIIIDTSPMALVADTEEYAQLADCTAIVVRQDVMEAGYINDAIDTLKSSGTHLLGCVFNNVYAGVGERLGIGGRYASGYHGYGSYGSNEK